MSIILVIHILNSKIQLIGQEKHKARMHSSRMRTVLNSSHLLGVSAQAGVCPAGSVQGYLPRCYVYRRRVSDWGVSAWGVWGCLHRGCLSVWGVCLGGACPGGCLPGGVSKHALGLTPPPPVDRMTDRCKNIPKIIAICKITVS